MGEQYILLQDINFNASSLGVLHSHAWTLIWTWVLWKGAPGDLEESADCCEGMLGFDYLKALE